MLFHKFLSLLIIIFVGLQFTDMLDHQKKKTRIMPNILNQFLARENGLKNPRKQGAKPLKVRKHDGGCRARSKGK